MIICGTSDIATAHKSDIATAHKPDKWESPELFDRRRRLNRLVRIEAIVYRHD